MMPMYQAKFLTHSNVVFSTVQFCATHDEAAITHASVALRTSIGMGHEIWRDGRLIHREIYDEDIYDEDA